MNDTPEIPELDDEPAIPLEDDTIEEQIDGEHQIGRASCRERV